MRTTNPASYVTLASIGTSIGVSIVAALVLAWAASTDASVRKRSFGIVDGKACDDLDCAMSKVRDRDFDFGVVLLPYQGYSVETVWLRLRRSDGTGSETLTVLRDNILGAGHAVGIFQFHEADVADTMGFTVDELRAAGFQIRPKIQSIGSGSGRQDKCPAVDLTYDAGKSRWKWSRTGGPSGVVGAKFTLAYKTSGSVNAVRCNFYGGANEGDL